MLIPYSTDAPIYYLPFSTGALILANIAVYVGVVTRPEEVLEQILPWMVLEYGTVNPVQWFTSLFMHGGIMHLVSNMFCLWGFGLVVEGKVGWWRFLLMYIGIGAGQSAVEQLMMLWADEGGSLGASSAIYGLMAICMIWAPQNEMSCVLIMFRIFVFEVRLVVLVGAALFMEFATGVLGATFAGSMKMAIGSEVLHLMGAAAGAAIGIYMLRKNWVDCENWDLFSCLAGKNTSTFQEEREDVAKEIAAMTAPKVKPADPSVQQTQRLQQIHSLLAASQWVQALAIHHQEKARNPQWILPEKEMLKLIGELRKQQDWHSVLPLMREYMAVHFQNANRVRLALAQILIDNLGRPGQALQVLEPLNEALIEEPLRPSLKQLRAKGTKMAAANPLEEVEVW